MAIQIVDEYIATLDGWKAEVVSRVRVIIREAAPDAQEKYKWAQPVYEVNGPLCYMKAFKNSVNFGFWRGVDLDDPLGLLQGSGKKMRHVSLGGMDDINETAFTDFIQQAARLNLELGDPTKG